MYKIELDSTQKTGVKISRPAIFTKKIEINPEREAEVDAIEAREREREKQVLYEKAVPRRYHNENINTYKTDTEEQKQAKNIVIDFIEKAKKDYFITLILTGGAGTGKTHLGCAAIREVGGMYTTAQDVVEEYRKVRAFTSRENIKDLNKKYEQEKLVVIDEVGRTLDREEEVNYLYQVINARYNVSKPTMLISNHRNREEILRFFGAAINNRLIESGKFYGFSEGQKSYRIQKRSNDL